MSRTTTVRHPDGTMSTRTSKKAVYTYAVETCETAVWRVNQALSEATRLDGEADRYRAARPGPITRRLRPGFGAHLGTYWVEVGGVYVGSYAEDAEPMTDAEADAVMGHYIHNAVERAAQARQTAEDQRTTPHVYGVVRWSSRGELAVKEAMRWNDMGEGMTARAVPVEVAQ